MYDALTAPPRVEDLEARDAEEAIELLSARVYDLALQQGGSVPYTLVREVAENLIHAAFSEVVVTIMDRGATIRFSDQGPGIADKERAFLPGFSTASEDMKRYIRGVGSGLPIVRECLAFSGGTIVVEDNLGHGTVVTLRMETPEEVPAVAVPERPVLRLPRLSVRQKQVLSLVMELGSVGPTVVADELAVGVSTAYRDLEHLERLGLVTVLPGGKRELTDAGVSCLDQLFSA